MVGPIIDELATEYEGKVIIGKCDVDENGGAFGKIVSSIVADVIMPPIGLLVGGDACLRFSADFPESISTRNILDFDRGSYLLVCCGRQLFFPVISGK